MRPDLLQMSQTTNNSVFFSNSILQDKTYKPPMVHGGGVLGSPSSVCSNVHRRLSKDDQRSIDDLSSYTAT